MILKGSPRGNGAQLARHLLNARENEHVEVYELRGFVGEGLAEAFMEAEAVAAGTRCRQFLFSLSLNPPEGELVDLDAFEDAIEKIEVKLGLENQPRAIVFHEKEGRRHAHAVWSRIDAERMTAIPMPFFKTRLMEVSRDLYLEHDWSMPKGLLDRHVRNPFNFTRAEWQQAKRVQQNPQLIKAAFRRCWETSDTPKALQNALEERGYFLARGDRRGFVAIDVRGEVYALARWSGVKTRDVRERLGDPEQLPSVDETRAMIAGRMTDKLRGYVREVKANYRRLAPSVEFKRQELVRRQRDERKALEEQQDRRWTDETNARAARLPKGLGGLWSWITGKYAKIRHQNEVEAWHAWQRDRAEKDALIAQHLDERRSLQRSIRDLRHQRSREIAELNAEIVDTIRMGGEGLPDLRQAFDKAAQPNRIGRSDRHRDRDGPELGA